jgi:hypothetical protein
MGDPERGGGLDQDPRRLPQAALGTPDGLVVGQDDLMDVGRGDGEHQLVEASRGVYGPGAVGNGRHDTTTR